MIVTILAITMTILEDLTVSIHFAYLTNTKYTQKKESKDLEIYKTIISLVYFLIILLQVKILIFKKTEIKFIKAIKGLKSNQSSIGGSTFTITLAIVSIQMFFVLLIQFVLKKNFTEPEIQGLRATIPNQIFVIVVLPLIWIVTTPNMKKCFKLKLKNVLKNFLWFHMNSLTNANMNEHDLEEARNEHSIEMETPNSIQQVNDDHPDHIDSLQIPSPDPGTLEPPISNLMLSSVAKASNSGIANEDKKDNLVLQSQSKSNHVQLPSTSTARTRSKNTKSTYFNTMPDVDC